MRMRIGNRSPRAGWVRLLIGGLLAVALGATAPSAEDCVGFNHTTVQSKLVNGRWKVVDGNHWILDFGSSQTNADRARDVIKFYKMTSICFIGRGVAPKPFMYFKVGAGYPVGSMAGQDALSFNPWNAWPHWTGSTWQVRDCGTVLADVGNNNALAWEVSNLMFYNRFRTKVFVGGRVDPGMTYFLVDQAYRPSISLAVTLRPQETSQWCWAASARMAMEYLGKSVSQCTQANDALSRSDCCNITMCPNPVANDPCVQPGWPNFAKYGFSSKGVNSALSWEDLWIQFACKRKPVAFAWAWVGGGGHMMVARGARVNADGSYMVQINDPWSPCTGGTRWITYATYVSQANSHTHMADIYDITNGGI